MTSAHMFLGFRGRIPRTTYWFAMAALAGLATAIYILAGTVVIRLWPAGRQEISPQDVYYASQAWGGISAIACLAIPALALTVKRAHDCDIPGFISVPVFFAALPYPLLTRAILLHLPGSIEQAEKFIAVMTPWLQLSLLLLVLGFAGLLAFGLLPATEGVNRFGPPPRGERDHEVHEAEDPA